MKSAIIVCFTVVLLSLCGCRPNATIGQIVSSGTDGSADDDSGNPDQYVGPAKMKATDGQTDASSIAPLFNKVGGSVHAIPFNGPAKRDRALAISNNKVVSTLTVNKADNFTFNLGLNLQAPNVTKHGSWKFSSQHSFWTAMVGR